MLIFAIVFSIAQGLLFNIPYLWTSGVINGVCYPLALWPTNISQIAYIWTRMIWHYLLLLVVFVFCYGNILKVVRKRKNISTTTVHTIKPSSKSNAPQVTNHAHQPTSRPYHVINHNQPRASLAQQPTNHAQNELYNKREVSIVKTMIIISVSYAITNFPAAFFSICWAHNFIFTAANKNIALYNSITFVFFYMNICLNPFIYVASHQDVKTQLKVILSRILFCKASANDDARQSLELSWSKPCLLFAGSSRNNLNLDCVLLRASDNMLHVTL